jgi:uncharacterized protein
MLSPADGAILVRLARESITTFFNKKDPKLGESSKFSDQQGVFVTLNKFGSLRGCIGYPEPVFPLNRAVVQSARAAAFQDPRFPPVKEDELADITIEISVLTLPELIQVEKPEEYLDKIKIGRDGLIIRSGYFSGLLLPIVPVEYDWTPKEFLEHTCMKAGLPRDAWKNLSNKLYSFQSQVFSEEEPDGKIKQLM